MKQHKPKQASEQDFHSSLNSENDDECLFCIKFGRKPTWKIDFSPLLSRALQSKYANLYKQPEEQNISDLIANSPIKWVIHFKDMILIEEKDEYCKRYYKQSEQKNKVSQLLEYYKYHIDLPRLFMKKLSNVANYFFEKKKQIEYKKIKQELGIPQDHDDQNEEQKTYNSQLRKDNQDLLKGLSFKLSKSGMSQVSTQSVLRQLVKNIDNDHQSANISDTWISMKQKENKQGLQRELKLFDQMIEKRTQIIQLPQAIKKMSSHQRLNSELLFKKYGQKLYTLQAGTEVLNKNNGKTILKLQTGQYQQIVNPSYQENKFKMKNFPPPSQQQSFSPKAKKQSQKQEFVQDQFNSKIANTNLQPNQFTKKSNCPIGVNIEIHTGQKQQIPLINKNDSNLIQRPFQLSDTDFQRFLEVQLRNIQRTKVNQKQESIQTRIPAPLNLARSISSEQFKQLPSRTSLHIQQSSPLQTQSKQSQTTKNVKQQQIIIPLQGIRKSFTQYTEASISPSPKLLQTKTPANFQSAKKLTQLMQVEPQQVSQRDKTHKHTMSQPSINININQYNMNSLNLQAPKNWMGSQQPKSTKIQLATKQVASKHLEAINLNYYHNKRPSDKQTFTPSGVKSLFTQNKSSISKK